MDKETIVITGINYVVVDDEPVIIVSGRNSERIRKIIRITGFKPYFFSSQDPKVVIAENPDIENRILSFESGFTTVVKTPVFKVTVKVPTDVSKLRPYFAPTWEDDILFDLRFLIDRNIKHTLSYPKGEYNANYTEVESSDDLELPSNLRILYDDTEYNNEDFRGNIQTMIDEAPIPFICSVSFDSYTSIFHVFLYLPNLRQETEAKWSSRIPDKKLVKLIYGSLDPKKVLLHIFPTEKETLSAYIDYIAKTEPDILTYYNSDGFDIPITVHRSKKLGLAIEKISPVYQYKTKMVQDRFRMSTKKDKALKKIYEFQHLNVLDSLTFYKTITVPEGRKKSYSLNNISIEELNVGKIPIPESIGKLWREKPMDLVRYNIADVENMLGIERKRGIFDFYDTLRRAAGIPLHLTKSGTKNLDMFFLRFAYKNHVLPSRYSGLRDEEMTGTEVEGAVVIDPSNPNKRAIINVIVIDLKTLYPMAMIALNMGLLTKNPDGEIIAPNGVRFDKSPDSYIRKVLKYFLDQREIYKGKVKEWKGVDDDLSEMYDRYQKAMKTNTNTAYGAMLNAGFRLMDRDIGAAIPATGQIVLKYIGMLANLGAKAKHCLNKLSFDSINEWFDWYLLNRLKDNGTPIIYGDSVTGETPVMIRKFQKEITVIPIEDMIGKWNDLDEERYPVDDYEVWSNGEWVKIDYIKRHKIGKKIYKIQTPMGICDATEDHSFFTHSSKTIAPSDIEEGTWLLHSKLPNLDKHAKESNIDYSINNQMAWLLGYCMFNGAASHYRYGMRNVYKFELSDKDPKKIKKALSILRGNYPEYSWNFKHKVSYQDEDIYSITYDYMPHETVDFITKNNYIGKQKTVPTAILNSPKQVRKNFLEGFGKGASSTGKYILVRTNFPVLAHTMIMLGESLGYKTSVNYLNSRPETYSIIISTKTSLNVADRRLVKSKIEIIPKDKWVYDIATKSGKFNAGVGKLVVHNTDSIFVKLDDKWTSEQCVEYGKEMEKRINGSFEQLNSIFNIDWNTFEVKFEKYFKTLFMVQGTKKQYAGWKTWEEDEWMKKFDITGYSAKKSDTSEFAAKIQKSVLRAICNQKSLDEIKVYIRNKVKEIRSVPVQELCPPRGVNSFTTLNKKTGQMQQRNDPYVRGIKFANMFFNADIIEGEKVRLLYITGTPSGYPNAKEICFKEIETVPKEFFEYVDYTKLVETNIEKKLKTILSGLDTSFQALMSTRSTRSLL